MEYLDGISLDKVLGKKQRLSSKRILTIIKQVCDGVNAAHKQSVTHRDLKPANIFVLDGDLVKVLDFGVAHFQNSQLTNSGMLLGTINYIAPEQITGLKVDYRADIFSIGVILYEMLAGLNPFLGKNISKTMVKIVNEDPPDPENVSPEILKILHKAIEKDRNKRYVSLRHMAGDIDALLRDMSLGAEADVRTLPGATRTNGAPKPAAAPAAKETQNAILDKMIGERIDGIKNSLRKDDIAQAKNLLSQLKRLKSDHPEIPALTEKITKARGQIENKRQFAEKFHHETLLKANEHLADRHFVLAIEMCNKVLAVDAGNQDAKVMRARGLRMLERFIQDQQKAF